MPTDETFTAEEVFKIEIDARTLGERYGRSKGRIDGRTAAYIDAAELVEQETKKDVQDFPAVAVVMRLRASAWTPGQVVPSRA